MNQMIPPPGKTVETTRRTAATNPYLSQLQVDLESLDQAEAVLKAQREGWGALTAREVQLCRRAINALASGITARKEALFR